MNKEEYREALKDPRWLAKRDIIKKRDKHKCTKCGCRDNLHVHHTYYLPNKMPWEVPDDCLITLCKGCHAKEHEGKDISSFIRTSPPKTKSKVTKNNKKTFPEKIKKLRFYKFMAVKSSTLNQVFDKSVNWKKVFKPHGSIIKGFDSKDLAEKWLKPTKATEKKEKLPRDKVIKDLEVFKYIAIKSDKVNILLKQNDMWLKALDNNRNALVKGFDEEVLAREWLNIKNNFKFN